MIKIQEGRRGGKEVSFMKVLTGHTKGISNRFCVAKFENPAGNLSSIVCSILHSQKKIFAAFAQRWCSSCRSREKFLISENTNF